jgi:hypothetical protein
LVILTDAAGRELHQQPTNNVEDGTTTSTTAEATDQDRSHDFTHADEVVGGAGAT